jgi:hypothetical protein
LRHVTFDESIFPFTKASFSTPQTIASSPPAPVLPVCMVPLDNSTLISIRPEATTPVTLSPAPGMTSPSSTTHLCSSASPLPVEPVLPTRTHSMVTRAQNNIFCPKQLSVTTKHPLPLALEPTCVSQALKDPRWRQAMADEFAALVSHGTWRLVPRPSASQLNWL